MVVFQKIFLMSFTLASVCWAQNLEIDPKYSYGVDTKDLQNLGPLVTPTTTTLVIRNSGDVYFPSYYHNLRKYENVIRYDILDNGQLTIEPFAFCCMTNLCELTIKGNNLPVVIDNSFQGLGKLTDLNLLENNITILEKNSFAGLTSLIWLSLKKNKITRLTPNVFNDVPELSFLVLQDNNIKSIDENSFVGLDRLRGLDLGYNKLRTLKSSDFNVFVNLRILSLRNNSIERIEGYLKLSELKYLFLDNNKLRNIDNDCFQYLDRVATIDIARNELRGLTSHPFRNLSSLSNLDVSDNSLNKSDFDDLKQVLVKV